MQDEQQGKDDFAGPVEGEGRFRRPGAERGEGEQPR